MNNDYLAEDLVTDNSNVGKGLLGRHIKAGTRFRVINIEPHTGFHYKCLQEYLGKIGIFICSFEFSDGGFHYSGIFNDEYIDTIDRKNGRLCWRYDEVEILG